MIAGSGIAAAAPTGPGCLMDSQRGRGLRVEPRAADVDDSMRFLRELRQLREENGRLKRLVADLSLDRQILQEIVSKKL